MLIRDKKTGRFLKGTTYVFKRTPETLKKMSESHKWQVGCLASAWKGGRKVDSDGYIEVYMPDYPNSNKSGYMKEHRYVMEKHLGRLLTKKEIVHHINEKRDDNRIENLQLFSNVTEHIKFHRENIRYWSTKGYKYNRISNAQ